MTTKKKIGIITSITMLLATIAALTYYFFFYEKSYKISQTAVIMEIDSANVNNPRNSSISIGHVIADVATIAYPQAVFKMDISPEDLKKNITIYPEIRGEWTLRNLQEISFRPANDWMPNEKYKVKINNNIFSDNVKVKIKEYTINAPVFNGWVDNQEFYEDPINTKIKKAVATFQFNYPINKTNLEKYVTVKTIGGDKYDFSVKPDDKYPNIIHIMTDPIQIKAEEDYAEIMVKGLKNAYNNIEINDMVTAKVKIPSISTFFKINSLTSTTILNEDKNNDAEQVLFLNFSTAVEQSEIEEYTAFYYTVDPCYKLRNNNTDMTNPENIEGIKKLEITPIVGEGEKTYMFRYDLQLNDACIFAKVKKGLGSKDGFILTDNQVIYSDFARYPEEANVAFDGSLISMTGDKRLALISRGVESLNVKIARINSDNINHLVSQTNGDFSHPSFRNYSFNEENISEIFSKDIPLNIEHSAKVNYASVDLNQYLANKKGIFIVEVQGKKGHRYTASDRRLVVVTDLGIIAKRNLDNSTNIFVSNFSAGKPVNGAQVELLGKNGIPILSGKTNYSGFVSFPDASTFKNDKEPTVFVVTNGSDVSYIPYNKYDRRIDYSKFEVGGVYDTNDYNKLYGYMFSDRGIYRPGEKADFAVMVRNANMDAPHNIPLKAIIIDSKGNETAVKKLWPDNTGLAVFDLNIAKNAPVGRYSISLYDESKTYSTYIISMDFQVEEFTPDNLRIKTTITNNKPKGWYKDEKITSKVSLHNLYGTPAAEHRIDAKMILSPTTFYFKEFADYNFKDPLRDEYKNIRTVQESLGSKNANMNGETSFEVDLSKYVQGTYKLEIDTSGFELDSGRSVFASATALVSPLEYIVGYKADGELYSIKKETERKIHFIAVDNDLNKIVKEELEVELYKINYVSSLMEMPNGTYKYQTVAKHELIKSETFNISENGGVYDINSKDYGEFYILLKEGSRVVSKVKFYIEGGRNDAYKTDKNSDLSIKLDKSQYNHGETIKIEINAPYEGYGLISIERDRVYTYKWFEAKEQKSTQEIELPNVVEGNAYINVAFVRDIKSKEIFMPALAFAVVPFDINKSQRIIDIDLDVPEKVKPGEELIVKYKTNKPAKIIIYGVNQGILQVAKYKLPDPLAEFMKKKALRVNSYQILDLIMPDMNLLLENKAAGGDEGVDDMLASQLNPFARKQDEVVAFWSGIIEADESVKEYTYKVPEIFNGQVKVMAIAVSENAIGRNEKSVFIRGDFAMIPSGPFNVSPEDVFEVGTSISNLVEGDGDNLEVKVTLTAEEGLEIIGDNEQIISMKENEEKSLRFNVKASDKLGSSTIRFTATAVNDESLTFSIPYHIGIRPASPYLTKLNMGYETSKITLENFLTPMYDEYRSQSIYASNSPLVLATGLLKFLDNFPHPCTEQIISKVYPAMTILFKHPELVDGIEVHEMFNEVTAKLNRRQKLDGGFAAWDGNYGGSNEISSIYTFDFLTMADKYGYNVPKSMLNKVANYAKSVAGRDINGYEDVNVAYAIYLLTRNGEVTTNYLVNAEQELEKLQPKKWKNSLTAAYMAASYKMLKNEEKAKSIIGKYKFGENSVDDARYVYIMNTHFAEDFNANGKEIINALIEPMKKGEITTNLAAYSLLALTAYSEEQDKEIMFEGKEADYTMFAKALLSSEDQALTVSSPRQFFYVVNEQGFALNPQEKEYSNFIELTKEYLDKNGKYVSFAKIGDEITVRINIRAVGKDYINDVAITDLLAGCFEIVLDSISASYDYKEEREDRALVYMGIGKQQKTITYKVKVVAKGEFVAPATYAEALYDPDAKANTKSAIFKVAE